MGTNLTPTKPARPRSLLFGPRSPRVLHPQSSRTFAVRDTKDSTNSDSRALTRLGQFRTPDLLPTPAEVQPAEPEFQSEDLPTTIEPGLKEHLGTEGDEKTRASSLIPSVQYTDCPEIDISFHHLLAKASSNTSTSVSTKQELDLQKDKTNSSTSMPSTALGTAALAIGVQEAPKIHHEPNLKPGSDLQASNVPVSQQLSVTPLAEKLTTPISHLENDLVKPPLSVADLPKLDDTHLIKGPKIRRRRKIIQRMRRLVLQKSVLSLLVGRQAAEVVHASLSSTTNAAGTDGVPNLDGTIGMMMPPPPTIFHTSRLLSRSSLGSSGCSDCCSARGSGCSSPKVSGYYSPKLSDGVRRSSHYPPMNLESRIQDDEVSSTGAVYGTSRCNAQKPCAKSGGKKASVKDGRKRKGFFRSLFRSRSSKQKRRSSWKFWRTTPKVVKMDDDTSGSKYRH